MKRAFRVLFQWLMKTFNNKKDRHYYFTNLIEVTGKKNRLQLQGLLFFVHARFRIRRFPRKIPSQISLAVIAPVSTHQTSRKLKSHRFII